MRKIITIMIAFMLAVTNVHANKIIRDTFENNAATYHQQTDEREDIIKFFVDSGDIVYKMHDLVEAAYKAGKLTDSQVKEFLKLAEEERNAGDEFWAYVKVMDDVADGKLPANKFSNRSFIWKYNNWVGKYNKLVKFTSNINQQ